MRKGRADVLEYLLSSGPYDPRGQLLKVSYETNNEKIISLVETRAKNLTMREKKEESEIRKQERKAKNHKKSWRVWGFC